MPIKWKPMLASMPFVAAVLLVKLLLHKLGQPGILDFSDLSVVYTGGVFLLGFNLAGTMADYKESERMPGELACIFETLEDSLKQAARIKPEFELDRCRKLHANTLEAIIEWLLRKESQPALFGDVASSIEVAYALDKAGTPAIAGRYVSELHNIRKCITRMGVISRTGALESGFAFLQFLTGAIILLLLLSKFKHPLSEVILVSFVSLIYIYMLRLIQDIDDPFEYNPDGRRRGCAEVELFPLFEYQQRLQERINPPASVVSAGPTSPATEHGPSEVHHGSGRDSASTSAHDHLSDPGEHHTMATTVTTTQTASTGSGASSSENGSGASSEGGGPGHGHEVAGPAS